MSKKLDKLAKRIYDKLQDDPRATVPQLAEELDVEEDDVAYILHSYFVEDGVPRHDGPGQGGGWVGNEVREQLMERLEPEFLGYRWPDGSLKEEAFDEGNNEHRAAVGLAPLSDDE